MRVFPLGPRKRDSQRTLCLRFPDAPPQSELFGECPHWQAPRLLVPGPDKVPSVTLSLSPGVYAYKLRTPDGRWHVPGDAPRTRSQNGLRNQVLCVGGTEEPVLHVPASPWVFTLPDGRLVIRAALRKGVSDSLSVVTLDSQPPKPWPMRLVAHEDEHLLFETGLPTCAQPISYVFRLASGRIVGLPDQTALAVLPEPSDAPSWWLDAVLYSVFLDRFRRGDGLPWPKLTDEKARAGGDLDGVRAALPYLADLGVTVLHLTPVCQSPSAHRYDAENPLVVDPALGGEAALSRLLSDASRLGVRVLLDLCLTHVHRDFLPFCDVRAKGPASPYASWFRVYRWPFSDGPDPGYEHYQHGQWQLPLFQTDNDDVLDCLCGVARHFLSLGVDGFRLDSAADVPQKWLAALKHTVHKVKKDALVLGELTVNNLGHYVPFGLDCATDFAFQTATTRWLSGSLSSVALGEMLSARSFDNGPSHAALTFLSTHDTPRLASLCGTQRARLGLVLLLCRPEIPMLYAGDELSLSSASPPRGFEDVWPERMPFPWAEISDDHPTLSLAKTLVSARRQFVALRRGEVLPLPMPNDTNLFAFRRQHGSEMLDVFLNPDDKPAHFALPEGPGELHPVCVLGSVEFAPGEDPHEITLGACSAWVIRRSEPRAALAIGRELLGTMDSRLEEAFSLGATHGFFLPSKLYLTLTERCNLRCQHCITHAPTRTRDGTARSMQPWVLDALDEAFCAANYLGFSHGGENLLSPLFFDTLARAKQARDGRRLDVHLLTNGMSLSPLVLEKLVAAGVNSLAISLDGGTAHTNDAIRAGGDFVRILSHLRDAVSFREATGADLRLGISTVLLAQTVDELPELARQAVALSIDWLKVEESYPVNLFAARSGASPLAESVQAQVSAARAICEAGGVVFVDHLCPPVGCTCHGEPDERLLEFRATDDFANRTTFAPCRALWEIACIDPDGHVHPGDYHTTSAGSLFERSFFSLWNGEPVQALRRDALAHSYRRPSTG